MKLCVQTGDVVDRLGFEKGYKAIKDAGFDCVDWNLDHAWKNADIRNGTYLGKSIMEKSLDEVIEYYAEELEVIKKNGLEISQAHAPFPCYVTEHPDVLDYAIEIYKRNIEYCDYIGCKYLVIHGASLALSDEINTLESIHEINLKLYSSLIPVLQKTDVTVCLENLFTTYKGVRYQGCYSNPEDAVADIDYLNSLAGKECFGFCFDTGHMNLLHRDPRVVIPVIGKRIKVLHLHDNNGSSDEHLAPFTGTINWNFVCDALREAGYTGTLSFETFHQTNIAMEYDEEMVHPWLKLIAETGKSFSRKITE